MKLYSKQTQLIFKIFSIAMMIALTVANLCVFLTNGFATLTNPKLFVPVIANSFFVFGFLIAFFFPTRIGVFSALSFLYSTTVFLLDPKSPIAVPMFFLALATLYARGSFKENKKIKIIIASVLYIALNLTMLRFGIQFFIDVFLDKLGMALVISSIVFFMQIYTHDIYEKKEKENCLDLSQYPDLTKRDSEWLRMILNGEKYTAISVDYKMAIGSVKNRLKFIFSTLGVGDKQGFLSLYKGFKICYGEEKN
ncbi:MAG: hypothetical protein II114_06470 [Treponema sp.]|nr:hypothetical protein [Treponema sp.]MBQ2530633.1 hypothetical protein [Treponema sp.]